MGKGTNKLLECKRGERAKPSVNKPSEREIRAAWLV